MTTEAVSALEPPAFSTTWGSAPSDNTQVQASHVRQEAQIALTNDAFLRVKRGIWVYDNETPPFTFNAFITNTYQPPGSGGAVEMPGCVTGDTIHARFVALSENGAAATGNGNSLRLAAIDDLGGGGETAPAAVPGARAFINTPVGELESLTIEGEWVVTVDGTTRIEVQGKVDTAPGPMYLQSSAVLYVEHRRAATEVIMP